MKYSLIIPVYNEKKTLQSTIHKISFLSDIAEFIFIDDGSTDGSTELLQDFKEITLIINKVNIGKGASIVKALELAQGEHIILFDGDLEIDPFQIKKVLTLHKNNENLVCKGNRWKDDKFHIKSPYDNANKILNKLFNYIYNTNHHDVFCCLIIIERNLLKSFKLDSNRFGIETEIMAKLAINKRDFLESKITYNRRKADQGKKLSIFDLIDILKVMISIKIKYIYFG